MNYVIEIEIEMMEQLVFDQPFVHEDASKLCKMCMFYPHLAFDPHIEVIVESACGT